MQYAQELKGHVIGDIAYVKRNFRPPRRIRRILRY